MKKLIIAAGLGMMLTALSILPAKADGPRNNDHFRNNNVTEVRHDRFDNRGSYGDRFDDRRMDRRDDRFDRYRHDDRFDRRGYVRYDRDYHCRDYRWR